MKILKVFLLTFVISFTMNGVNAQEIAFGPSYCENLPSFHMETNYHEKGGVCVNVIITSDAPAYLLIQMGDCIVVSENETTIFAHTFCYDLGPCSISEQSPITGEVYVTCGVDGTLCREGCWVAVEPD